MVALAVFNALQFTALLQLLHRRYGWQGIDWDLFALIGLQAVLAGVVLLGLTNAMMRGPAAPVFWLVMLGSSLFSIDIGLGFLSSFPKRLWLWRWYAYFQIGAGVGIASMVLLPLAGYLSVAADIVLAMVFCRAALTDAEDKASFDGKDNQHAKGKRGAIGSPCVGRLDGEGGAGGVE